MTRPDWLPALVLFSNYDGDWDRYVQVLYGFFKQDFVDSKPSFSGTKLGLKRHPIIQEKEATFWHLISEGKYEAERLPDLRRCERIRWPRPIIEHCNGDEIKIWENVRETEKRICLWFEEQEYLVVLAKRQDYILLWTAYPVTEDHRKRKLRREYEASKTAGAVP